MHAAIRKYSVDAESTDKLARKVSESLLPLIRGVPGFVAYYILCTEKGEVTSISIFESQGGVEEYNRVVLGWLGENLSELPLVSFTNTLTEAAVLMAVEEKIGGQTLKPESESESPDPQSSQLLSTEQLCEELGMSKSWVYRRLRSGEIPSVRLGKVLKVKRTDLDTYLRDHRYRAPTQS